MAHECSTMDLALLFVRPVMVLELLKTKKIRVATTVAYPFLKYGGEYY